jgi:pimeloyl-ACP methyl ester carboxylesterase
LRWQPIPARLPASGHWPFADAPETVERLLVEFLSD